MHFIYSVEFGHELYELREDYLSLVHYLHAVEPDGAVEADAVGVAHGVLAVRRSVYVADIADAPLGGAPDALVLDYVAGQLCAGVEAIGDMRHLEHAGVVKAAQVAIIFGGFLAAFDALNDTVLDYETDGLLGGVAEGGGRNRQTRWCRLWSRSEARHSTGR